MERVRLRALIFALVLATVGLVGCSSDDGPDEDSGLPSSAALTSYFQAVAGYDAAALRTAAEDVAAPGSPAQDYALYQAEVAQAAVDAGQPYGSFEVTRTKDGAFTACGSDNDGACATWEDLEGADGRLTDFSVDDTRLDDSLVDLTGQDPIDVDGLFTVQPHYAYRSPLGGDLYVVAAIDATAVAVQPQPSKALYVEQAVTLNGEQTPTPATVEAGQSGLVVLRFADAQDAAIDGQVTLPVRAGGTAQTIGFGLSASSQG